MNYTTKKPSEPGWYWVKGKIYGAHPVMDFRSILEIGHDMEYDKMNREVTINAFPGGEFVVSDVQFAGPIPEPEE